MSLKHLFAGVLFAVFTVALGYDPAGVTPVVLAPGVVGADKTPGPDGSDSERAAAKEKPNERAAREAAKDKPRDKDQKTAREMTWAQRLVFPSGNKF